MTFSESLRQYMNDIPCSAAELSAVSGLAPSMLSRYLRSEQTPGDKAIKKLAAGLDFLSRDKGGPSLGNQEVYHTLLESLSGIRIDYDHFIRNLQTMLSGLNVNNHELAKSLSFDPSYISRILAGTRKPANLFQFIANVSDYIANRFFDTPYLSVIADITECDVKELPTISILSYTVKRYLGSYTNPAADVIPRFLLKLDTFDPGEWEIPRLRSGISQLPQAAYCRGVPNMLQADLDFLTATAASSAADDVILFNDMPIADVATDRDFVSKFDQGLMQVIDRGHFVHYIHDVHRPFGELLSEVESLIPHYLSGRIESYYINEPTNHTFMHFIRSSGGACIYGEAIFGNPGGGRFSFSRNADDISYIRERASELLSRSNVLLEAYTVNRKDELNAEKRKLFLSAGSCQMIRTVPPFFTMSEMLLEQILKRTGLSEKEAGLLRSEHSQTAKYFSEILSKNQLIIDLPEIKEDETVYLSLPGLFFGKKIAYTREEYDKHIQDLKDYSIRHPSVSIRFGRENVFKNLEVMMFKEKCVLISRCRDPEAHFIVYYPKLVRALESLAV